MTTPTTQAGRALPLGVSLSRWLDDVDVAWSHLSEQRKQEFEDLVDAELAAAAQAERERLRAALAEVHRGHTRWQDRTPDACPMCVLAADLLADPKSRP